MTVAESSKDLTSDCSVFLSSYGNTQISAAPELWRLCEGGAYWRVVLIRGWHLFEGGAYSRATLIRGRRLLTFPLHVWHLIEGGAYSGAVLIQVNTVYPFGGSVEFLRGEGVSLANIFGKESLKLSYIVKLAEGKTPDSLLSKIYLVMS